MEWPLNREYNTVANTRRIWYFSNSLQGTHGAEDWYATPASPDGACGASIKSVYGGLVTFSGSAAGGQVVIIEHVLPDNSLIYMAHRHCALGTLMPLGFIDKGEELCQMGDTGADDCHDHWELTSSDQIEDQELHNRNPWYDGPHSNGQHDREPFILKSDIAKYGSPSLFLDDWGNRADRLVLVEDQWVEFTSAGYVPISLVFLEYQVGQNTAQITLKQAVDIGAVAGVQYRDESLNWQNWTADNRAFLVVGQDYRIMLNDDADPGTTQWQLVIPIPGHNEQEDRAKMELIQWANSHACTDITTSSCFTRVEVSSMETSETVTHADWDIRQVEAKLTDVNGVEGNAVHILHATNKENPLFRCVLGVDLDNGSQNSLWFPLAPGKVYVTPDESIEFVADVDDITCNEDLDP